MKVILACPAPPGSRRGNRVTAVRYARLLRELGHTVRVLTRYRGEACDVLVALHARKMAEAVRDYRAKSPHGPLVVVLTGTDLYRDLPNNAAARRSLELADRLVVLQARGLDELSSAQRRKARVVVQSAQPSPPPRWRHEDTFDVCVLGHLRTEKDPFRAALALRRLPQDSRVRILHAGEALRPAQAERAQMLMRRDARYVWLGELARPAARRLLARSRVLVVSSRMEGGANVICEALADRVPVLASAIPGNVGLLGPRYPGYFPVGDTRALAALLARVEGEPAFLARLARACAARAPLVEPARERAGWAALLAELTRLAHCD